MKFLARPTVLSILLLLSVSLQAQMVTGVWHGKINKQAVEVKIIQNGDSLTGTSYYGSARNYRRYTIKGYFDQSTNEVVWWDDRLIEEKVGGVLSNPGKMALLSRADFNCPGGKEMYLDGSTGRPDEEPIGNVHLQKVYSGPNFPDEWDYVIENYTRGTNNPDIIDSIALVAIYPDKTPKPVQSKEPRIAKTKPGMVSIPPMPEKREAQPKASAPVVTKGSATIEEKFLTRKKIFTTEIPVEGDSIELRFYDNAEIDGDSISLFLNDKMLFTHVRLTDKAYTIKLPVVDLSSANELVMVAENLGSIPPNTSYMVAIVGGKRYEAKLASTENSSAMIRLNKINSKKE
jgi:hypothetical protein